MANWFSKHVRFPNDDEAYMDESLSNLVVGSDYGEFSLTNYGKFSRSLTAVLQAIHAVHPDVARQLDNIRGEYVGRGSLEGEYAAMNNRTVARIFAEYIPMATKPLASGEVDGVKYDVYEAPQGSGREAAAPKNVDGPT
jgi:hypothetical protein